ncbi:Fpg/Nei family DNA glycosylase [Ilumatobacter sp.]|uniref:Fpg/Nei family DNA glycosylase n=1 Tax=Ilumatobacter sp. TaxID=1967498 RepID=UPI003B528121
MPEGHTIHRIARDHSKLLVGREVAVSSPQGRFAADAERVDGHVLERIEAYGKHLFYHWDSREIGHVHLGLFGKYRISRSGDDGLPEPRGQVRMRLATDDVAIDLAGPTACTIDPPGVRRGIIARLGPDPLRRRSKPDAMIERVSRSRRGVGDLLMDQSVVAGVGNVYRAESLFVCGIHPLRTGTDCDPAELEALWATISGMLRQGVKDGRIVTVGRDESGVARNRRIPRSEATYVYKRERCLRCGSEIVRLDIANRTSYHCPLCQPR